MRNHPIKIRLNAAQTAFSLTLTQGMIAGSIPITVIGARRIISFILSMK